MEAERWKVHLVAVARRVFLSKRRKTYSDECYSNWYLLAVEVMREHIVRKYTQIGQQNDENGKI